LSFPKQANGRRKESECCFSCFDGVLRFIYGLRQHFVFIDFSLHPGWAYVVLASIGWHHSSSTTWLASTLAWHDTARRRTGTRGMFYTLFLLFRKRVDLRQLWSLFRFGEGVSTDQYPIAWGCMAFWASSSWYFSDGRVVSRLLIHVQSGTISWQQARREFG
jgi:hypothetical protein